MSSREELLTQIELERESAEQQALVERGPDEILAASNPGVIVVPTEVPYEFPLGLSGSLTKLVDGSDYLIAGANITLMTGANGAITISAQSSGVSAGGDNTQVQFNDGGSALGGDPQFTFNKTTNTLSVTNISGSLTKLVGGSDYMVAGPGITLSTGSNGSITIGSASPSWSEYTPTITSLGAGNPTLPSLHDLHGRYLVQGKVMTVIFNFSGTSSAGSVAGDGNYAISLPAGQAIDTVVMSLGTSGQSYLDGTPAGTAALITDNAGSGGAWSVVPVSTTSVVLLGQNPASAGQPIIWGSGNYPIGSADSYRVSFVATIPIV